MNDNNDKPNMLKISRKLLLIIVIDLSWKQKMNIMKGESAMEHKEQQKTKSAEQIADEQLDGIDGGNETPAYGPGASHTYGPRITTPPPHYEPGKYGAVYDGPCGNSHACEYQGHRCVCAAFDSSKSNCCNCCYAPLSW